MTTATVTTASSHGMKVGDKVTITGTWQPWYIRLWHWLTFYKPPSYVITSVTPTTFTYESFDD